MPIIVAEIIAFIKPKMMSHELPYIYTILGHFLTRIVVTTQHPYKKLLVNKP